MNLFINKYRFRGIFRAISLFVILAFGETVLIPGYIPKALAQNVLALPETGAMVALSPSFTPAILRGLQVFAKDPLKLNFIVDHADSGLKGEDFEKEAQKLINYFLAALAFNEKDLWVNLSPYEKDRIVPDDLGKTEMGRDMLAQDYLLKQVTASMIHPESKIGKQFWQRVYQQAYEQYGTTEIPIDTFNKVWIVPQKAKVYVKNDRAFVIESSLKVMLEEDYVATQQSRKPQVVSDKNENFTAYDLQLTAEIVRDIIIPELEHEVNYGKNFAQLRQIYHSMILATWFKDRLKESIVNQIYANQGKVKGVDLVDSNATQQIYQKYLAAFQKGVCDLIKIEKDARTNKNVPRKYFSGGIEWIILKNIEYFSTFSSQSPAWVATASSQPPAWVATASLDRVDLNLEPVFDNDLRVKNISMSLRKPPPYNKHHGDTKFLPDYRIPEVVSEINTDIGGNFEHNQGLAQMKGDKISSSAATNDQMLDPNDRLNADPAQVAGEKSNIIFHESANLLSSLNLQYVFLNRVLTDKELLKEIKSILRNIFDGFNFASKCKEQKERTRNLYLSNLYNNLFSIEEKLSSRKSNKDNPSEYFKFLSALESFREFLAKTDREDFSFSNVSLRLVDFNIFIQNIVESYSYNNIRIDLDFSSEVGEIPLDVFRFGHVILNLLRNARESMGNPGGRISIDVGRRDNFLEIIVSDTGSGIAPEIYPRLFDPGATHGKTEGSGIGLNLCKIIVEAHQGTITAENIVGEQDEILGAQFIIRLPLKSSSTINSPMVDIFDQFLRNGGDQFLGEKGIVAILKKETKMTLVALGEEFGVGPDTLSGWIKGKKEVRPNDTNLLMFADKHNFGKKRKHELILLARGNREKSLDRINATAKKKLRQEKELEVGGGIFDKKAYFSWLLNELIDYSGLSSRYLAELAGVSFQTIEDWKNGFDYFRSSAQAFTLSQAFIVDERKTTNGRKVLLSQRKYYELGLLFLGLEPIKDIKHFLESIKAEDPQSRFDALKELRIRQGLTIEQMATIAGVDKAMYARYEKDGNFLQGGKANIDKVVEALNIPQELEALFFRIFVFSMVTGESSYRAVYSQEEYNGFFIKFLGSYLKGEDTIRLRGRDGVFVRLFLSGDCTIEEHAAHLGFEKKQLLKWIEEDVDLSEREKITEKKLARAAKKVNLDKKLTAKFLKLLEEEEEYQKLRRVDLSPIPRYKISSPASDDLAQGQRSPESATISSSLRSLSKETKKQIAELLNEYATWGGTTVVGKTGFFAFLKEKWGCDDKVFSEILGVTRKFMKSLIEIRQTGGISVRNMYAFAERFGFKDENETIFFGFAKSRRDIEPLAENIFQVLAREKVELPEVLYQKASDDLKAEQGFFVPSNGSGGDIYVPFTKNVSGTSSNIERPEDIPINPSTGKPDLRFRKGDPDTFDQKITALQKAVAGGYIHGIRFGVNRLLTAAINSQENSKERMQALEFLSQLSLPQEHIDDFLFEKSKGDKERWLAQTAADQNAEPQLRALCIKVLAVLAQQLGSPWAYDFLEDLAHPEAMETNVPAQVQEALNFYAGYRNFITEKDMSMPEAAFAETLVRRIFGNSFIEMFMAWDKFVNQKLLAAERQKNVQYLIAIAEGKGVEYEDTDFVAEAHSLLQEMSRTTKRKLHSKFKYMAQVYIDKAPARPVMRVIRGSGALPSGLNPDDQGASSNIVGKDGQGSQASDYEESGFVKFPKPLSTSSDEVALATGLRYLREENPDLYDELEESAFDPTYKISEDMKRSAHLSVINLFHADGSMKALGREIFIAVYNATEIRRQFAENVRIRETDQVTISFDKNGKVLSVKQGDSALKGQVKASAEHVLLNVDITDHGNEFYLIESSFKLFPYLLGKSLEWVATGGLWIRDDIPIDPGPGRTISSPVGDEASATQSGPRIFLHLEKVGRFSHAEGLKKAQEIINSHKDKKVLVLINGNQGSGKTRFIRGELMDVLGKENAALLEEDRYPLGFSEYEKNLKMAIELIDSGLERSNVLIYDGINSFKVYKKVADQLAVYQSGKEYVVMNLTADKTDPSRKPDIEISYLQVREDSGPTVHSGQAGEESAANGEGKSIISSSIGVRMTQKKFSHKLGRTLSRDEWDLVDALWTIVPSSDEQNEPVSMWQRVRNQQIFSKKASRPRSADEDILDIFRKMDTVLGEEAEQKEKFIARMKRYVHLYIEKEENFEGLEPFDLLKTVLAQDNVSRSLDWTLIVLSDVIDRGLIKSGETIVGIAEKFHSDPSQWRDIPDQSSKKKSISGRKPMVLLVDDNPDQIRELKASLEDTGYEVVFVMAGQTGLKKIKESIPDLIVTDWEMPLMDGIAFVKRLKNSYPDIPVVFRSGGVGSANDIHEMRGSFILAAFHNVVAVSGKFGEEDIALQKIKEFLKISSPVGGGADLSQGDDKISSATPDPAQGAERRDSLKDLSEEKYQKLRSAVLKHFDGIGSEIEESMEWFLPYVDFERDQLEGIVSGGLQENEPTDYALSFPLDKKEYLTLREGIEILAQKNIEDLIVTTYGAGDLIPDEEGDDNREEIIAALSAIIESYSQKRKKANVTVVVYDCFAERLKEYNAKFNQLIAFVKEKYPKWKGDIKYRVHYGDILKGNRHDTRFWKAMVQKAHIVFWRHTWVGHKLIHQSHYLDRKSMLAFKDILKKNIDQGVLLVKEGRWKGWFFDVLGKQPQVKVSKVISNVSSSGIDEKNADPAQDQKISSSSSYPISYRSLLLANERRRKDFISNNPHFQELIAEYKEAFDRLVERHSIDMFNDIYDWSEAGLAGGESKYFFRHLLKRMIEEFPPSQLDLLLYELVEAWKHLKNFRIDSFNALLDAKALFEDPDKIGNITRDYVRLSDVAGRGAQPLFRSYLLELFKNIDKEALKIIWPEIVKLSERAGSQKITATISALAGLKDKLHTEEDVRQYGNVLLELAQDSMEPNDYFNESATMLSGIALVSPFVNSPDELRVLGQVLIEAEKRFGDKASWLFSAVKKYKALYTNLDGLNSLMEELLQYKETAGFNALKTLNAMAYLVKTNEDLKDVMRELENIFGQYDEWTISVALESIKNLITTIPELKKAGEELIKVHQKGDWQILGSGFEVVNILIDSLDEIVPMADELIALQIPEDERHDVFRALGTLREMLGDKTFRKSWASAKDLINRAGEHAPHILNYGIGNLRHLVQDEESFKETGNQLLLLAQRFGSGNTFYAYSDGLSAVAPLIKSPEDVLSVGSELARMREATTDSEEILFHSLNILSRRLGTSHFKRFWPAIVESSINAGDEAWKILEHGAGDILAILSSEDDYRTMGEILLDAFQRLRHRHRRNHGLLSDGVMALQHLITDLPSLKVIVDAFVSLEHRFDGQHDHFYRALGNVMRRNKENITDLSNLNAFMDGIYESISSYSQGDHSQGEQFGFDGDLFTKDNEMYKDSLAVLGLDEKPKNLKGLKKARNAKVIEMYKEDRSPDQIQTKLNLDEMKTRDNPEYKEAHEQLSAIHIAFEYLSRFVKDEPDPSRSSSAAGNESDAGSSSVADSAQEKRINGVLGNILNLQQIDPYTLEKFEPLVEMYEQLPNGTTKDGLTAADLKFLEKYSKIFDNEYYQGGSKANYTRSEWKPDDFIPRIEVLIKEGKIKKTDKILDYGSALGFYVRAFREKGYEAFGAEISSYAVDQSDPPIKDFIFLLNNLRALKNLEKEEFDIVVVKHILEHVPIKILPRFLVTLSRLAKRAFIMLPIADSDGQYVNFDEEKDVTHVLRKEKSWWLKLLGENYQENENVNTFFKGEGSEGTLCAFVSLDESFISAVTSHDWSQPKGKEDVSKLDPAQDDNFSSSAQAPGGIDFNPQTLDLQTQGDQIEFEIPPELQGIDLNSIQGFVPIIINITPVTNVWTLMGLNKEDFEDSDWAQEIEADEPRLSYKL